MLGHELSPKDNMRSSIYLNLLLIWDLPCLLQLLTWFHVSDYSLNVNEWKFHSPIEWNSCKPLKKEWFCTLNSKFPLIKSENDSKKSELPLIWGVKRRIVLRLTPQTSGNSLFLESFSLYMSGNLLFNVQNHSFLSGLQEFHSFGEWNFHLFTFREYCISWNNER